MQKIIRMRRIFILDNRSTIIDIRCVLSCLEATIERDEIIVVLSADTFFKSMLSNKSCGNFLITLTSMLI